MNVTDQRPSRRVFLQVGAAALGCGLSHSSANAQQLPAAPITTTNIGGGTLFQGAGCNVVAVPGPEGALMIDGGRAASAEALVAAVTRATGTMRVHTLVNTHWHPEQTGANEI